ncbi:hypothetical protein COMA2_210049 [Candidatus Nitrospira nitrificans]|uniref:Uncharacterized protein n=1 Tax=Candidatus Nitrospira nitrificans TaxID=1742973 RepID=A0A0S4LF94_9BACT|nr:hypothetical protein COMA2_210049 [Candidatus Nitrospira nitrificans]
MHYLIKKVPSKFLTTRGLPFLTPNYSTFRYQKFANNTTIFSNTKLNIGATNLTLGN